MSDDYLNCSGTVVDQAIVRKFAMRYLDVDLDDIDHIDTPAMRLLLLAQRTLDDNDLVHAPFSVAVDVIRQAQIEEDGLRRYLSNMLGDKAGWEAQNFTLWYGDYERNINGRGGDRLIDVLADLAESSGLPDRVSFNDRGREKSFYI